MIFMVIHNNQMDCLAFQGHCYKVENVMPTSYRISLYFFKFLFKAKLFENRKLLKLSPFIKIEPLKSSHQLFIFQIVSHCVHEKEGELSQKNIFHQLVATIFMSNPKHCLIVK